MKKNQRKEIAVVTGACGGIGKATVEMLLKNNYFVIALSKSGAQTEKVANLLKLGNDISYYQVDFFDHENVYAVFKKITQDFNTIDVLVNNAGVSSGKDLERMQVSDLKHEIDINLISLHLCVECCMPLFIENQGEKSIINIASERGQSGSPDSSVGYAATKAAVISLTKSYALQLAKYNVRVNCVSPAAIYPTGMSENWSDELQNIIKKAVPLQKLGSPQDIAYAIEFLISEKAGFITGETLNVNGGLRMF